VKRNLLSFSLAIASVAQIAPFAGAQGYAAPIAWRDVPLVAARGHDQNGQRSSYTCPPGGDPRTFDSRIYGTDVYTDDSPVCVAAVHAGLISFAAGGTVTVQVQRPGLAYYTGSTRNGVNSSNWDNRPNPTLGAYTFVVSPGDSAGVSGAGAGNGGQGCQMGQTFNQAESRDAYGRLTVEAAAIDVVICSGQQFYIYQYLNRPGFRAIRPPNWAQAIGGRDYATFAEALAAAAASVGSGYGSGGYGGGNGGGGAVATGTLIKWTDYPLAAARGHDVNGQRSTFTCPPGGDPRIANTSGRITGTDVYSDDSPICVAAVHAGLIGFAGGGTVTVQVMRPGPSQLVGSMRNGVTSLSDNNGTYPTLGAFTFVR